MEQISFYLKKFENLGLKESNIKKTVADCIKDATGIELSVEDIEVTNNQIKINKTGVEKTEIFIKKSKIESAIKEKLQINRRVN